MYTKFNLRLAFFIVLFLFCAFYKVQAQQIPQTFQGKTHMLSPDEIRQMDKVGLGFNETPPPNGYIRNIAEFERMEGVLVTYLSYSSTYGYFGIPLDLIAEMSEDVIVYTVVEDTLARNAVIQKYQNAGVTMEHVVYVIADANSYWSRDYSPWFVANNNQVSIINFPYNRPRPDDNEMPNVFGSFWEAQVYGMNLISTGGNYMTDGMGIAASCDLVLVENPGLKKYEVEQKVFDYLGIETYHLLADPLDDYIEHIDCWGKFLDVDKILITKVPYTDYRYSDFEAMSSYWENQISSYGNFYRVYRVYSPNGQPYTNSLIVNNKVMVPIVTGAGSQWNDSALAVYREAMPGYEIIGFEQDANAPWESTDALHCRTHEIPKKEMLHIHHLALFETLPKETETVSISAFIASYGECEIASVLLNYKLNNGEYQQLLMHPMPSKSEMGILYSVTINGINAGDTISYYIQAIDALEQSEFHPFIGASDPHIFYVEPELISLKQKELVTTLNVFPNPVFNHVSLVFNHLVPENIEISLFDLNGQLIFMEAVSWEQPWMRKTMNLDFLIPGAYLLVVKNGDVILRKNLIKAKG